MEVRIHYLFKNDSEKQDFYPQVSRSDNIKKHEVQLLPNFKIMDLPFASIHDL